ncbi:MAG: RNB domain-containing ribonuclease [Acidothermales bacterium]|nr:RNB domain-containing ribonuclease [Acidothermales bacterium]
MPRRIVRVADAADAADAATVRAGLDAVRTELEVPTQFPPEVLAEAAQAVREVQEPERDETAVPFFTVDPPGARDLDQAMHLSRRNGGFRLRYAIADVAAFVRPSGAVDHEAHARGVTLYAPDAAVPLHPPALAYDAASLLPDRSRPAVVWTLDLDEAGEGTAVEVHRALVRSRAQLSFAEVQRALDDETAEEPFALLREIGMLREVRERERGAVTLAVPEQEISAEPDGWRLSYRAPLPVEGWNAQLSVMTGIAAAELMLYGEVGVLRTLPAADPAALIALRRSAAALGVEWRAEVGYPQLVRSLDPSVPAHAALLDQATELLRGAGYTSFDGGVPEQATHAGVAAEYTHVTAPLRRLVDRYASEACVALSAGTPVPDWVRAALPALPEEMAAADRRADALERAVVDFVEAVLLSPRVGDEFDAVVVDVRKEGGVVQLHDPAVRARVSGDDLKLGAPLRVKLVTADPGSREVLFAPAITSAP